VRAIGPPHEALNFCRARDDRRIRRRGYSFDSWIASRAGRHAARHVEAINAAMGKLLKDR